jgi:glycosyltransferase involved in cell wall biosynthesis
MPVYNGAAHLREALDTLLAQTFADFEVIISDNASTDETPAIIAEYAARDPRIRHVRQEVNRGAAANFNTVFAMARGKYFKWFAHDDRLAPTYLERCVEVLEKEGSGVVLVFPERVEITEEGTLLGLDRRVHWYEAAPPYDRISLPRMLLVPDRRYPELVFGLGPTEVWRRTGLVGAFHAADLVLVLEMRLRGQFRHIQEPLFINRLHERRELEEEAHWYDPVRADTLRRPGWRLLKERICAVGRADVGIGRKVWALLCVLICGHLIARTPPWIMRWAKQIARPIYHAWERLTVWALRAAGEGLWPHRTWLFLSGLRRLNFRTMSTACAPGEAGVEQALVDFVAQRLAYRRDPASHALLVEWLHNNRPAKRIAALKWLGASQIAESGASRPVEPVLVAAGQTSGGAGR